MFHVIGPYIIYAIMFILLAFSGTIVYLIYREYKQNQKIALEREAAPKEASLADQIQEQFKEEDLKKERTLYTKSGVERVTMKETKSVFSFGTENTEDDDLTLESHLDIAEEQPFLDKDERFQ